MLRGRFLQLAVAAIAWAGVYSVPAAAQQYPDRAVKIIVPFAAGGPTDVVARVIELTGLKRE
jgi:tripartite-type tricarboxylate transporter receptor subunit TctC